MVMFKLIKQVGIKHADRRLLYKSHKYEIVIIKYKIKKKIIKDPSYSEWNLYTWKAINKINEHTYLGIKINGQKWNMLHFADDIMLNAENKRKTWKY